MKHLSEDGTVRWKGTVNSCVYARFKMLLKTEMLIFFLILSLLEVKMIISME